MWIRRKSVLAAIVVLGALVLAGLCCDRALRPLAEAIRVAVDAEDGSFTARDGEGREWGVEFESAGKEGGKTVATLPDGRRMTTTQWGPGIVSEKDIGIAFYPGATVGMGAIGGTTTDPPRRSMSVALETTDPFDKVAGFYRAKYAQGGSVQRGPKELTILVETGPNAGTAIVVTQNDSRGVTEIGIAR